MKKSKLQFSTPILKSSYISINDAFIASNKPDSLNDIEMTIDHEVGYSERDGNYELLWEKKAISIRL